ncbi:hypothetical protein ROHU_000561 [Labeo rohita]|uniref:Uncharacterized protein n=1 Tax=Labeo rohita TaxID=84645 RepID=A0A498MCI5_LABRO|nr:hypothetical protein ROHU_027138 [Labeo rohita]RXN39054.1 hypothetical protein ROHU_000561 [Labeo rohita]
MDRHGARAEKERVIAETAAHLELSRSSRGRSADGEEERGERAEGGSGVTGAAQKVGGERDGPPHFGGRCSICRWLMLLSLLQIPTYTHVAYLQPVDPWASAR